MPQLITTWVQRLKRHKVMVQNFGYLSVMQAFTMLVPLIVLPYLIAVLGAETYGLVVFAQAVVFYFATLISYGFNVSATKEISIHRDDKDKLSEIVSSVLIVKGGLFLLVLCLMPIVLWLLPQASGHETLFYLTLYLCVFEWLFPVWYFQGVENMKHISMVNFISRGIFLFLIFWIVKSPDDYLLVPIIHATGSSVAIMAALCIVFYVHNISFRWQSISVLKRYATDSTGLFTSNFLGVLKERGSTFFVGVLIGLVEVAYYDLASKITMFIRSVFLNMMAVVFPRTAKNKNANQIKKTIWFIVISSLGAYVLILLFAEDVVSLFGKSMQPAASIMYVLGLWLIFGITSGLIGNLILIPYGCQSSYVTSAALSACVYICLIVGVFVLAKLHPRVVDACLIASLSILSVLVELLLRLIQCHRAKLLNCIW